MGDAEPIPMRQPPVFTSILPPPSIMNPAQRSMTHLQPAIQQRPPPPTDMASMNREDTEMGDAESVPIRQTPIFQFSLPSRTTEIIAACDEISNASSRNLAISFTQKVAGAIGQLLRSEGKVNFAMVCAKILEQNPPIRPVHNMLAGSVPIVLDSWLVPT
jgi:hypothetical protein